MELIVSHMSAADFWRTVYPVDRVPSSPDAVLGERNLACNEEDVWQLAPTWVTPRFLEPERGVLHVLVESGDKRRRTASHLTHVWSGDIPPGALYDLGGGAFVTSPAFTFLLLAQSLDLAQLVCYGCELCGTYGFDRRAERGFRTRGRPLISKETLSGFISEARGLPGVKRARAALKFVVEGSASPRETMGALQLGLPYRYGGYGLGGFQLNFDLPLKGRARHMYARPSCVIDLCFPGKRLAVEYLGLYDHSGAEAIANDRGRTLALAEMDYKVIELTKLQMDNLVSFETVALRIAGILGKRIEGKYRGALPARIALRRSLRSWNMAAGRAKP